MKKTTILIVWALLCLNFNVYPQDPKSLNLGMKIPEPILNQKFSVLNLNSKPIDSLSLSQFKGKLILLDFWATWCSTCIYKFELLGKLQTENQDQFQVLLVNSKSTKDTPNRMEGVLSGKKAPFIATNLPTIYNDTLLTSLFPHGYLPHYVWIGAKGELLAITNAELVTRATLQSFLTTMATIDRQKEAITLKSKP